MASELELIVTHLAGITQALEVIGFGMFLVFSVLVSALFLAILAGKFK